MIIESTSNNKIKDIRKLNEKKYRDESKKYIKTRHLKPLISKIILCM